MPEIAIAVFRLISRVLACPMNVIHKDQEHLVSFSSDEVALLLDLCFAGACSDLLPATSTAKTRVRRFVGQVQECLLATAQQEWVAKGSPNRQET